MKAILLFLSITFLFSHDIKPAVLFDTHLITDNSWNETIYKGIRKFEQTTAIPVETFHEKNEAKAVSLLRDLAARGFSPILLSYTAYRKELIVQIMADNPKTRFIILNGSFSMPNAHYLSFSYQESSFLAGYLAAKTSKTKTIGFVGGPKIPLIQNFLCGYMKGAKYADKNITVFYEFIGSSIEAFTNPDKAYTLAKAQISKGADVVFSPAGNSTLGALKAAAEEQVYGIGVDSNQNDLFPGSVLTSAMTRVDNAVFRALMAAHKNIWGSQMKVMGLQEKGVELAFDEHNRPLISKELKREIDNLTANIILKKIKLEPFSLTHQCTHEGEVLF